MTFPERRIVQHRTDGQGEVVAPGSTRASSIAPTQADAISKARRILSKTGGELQIRGLNGVIRAQDTIAPGHDPRKSRG